MAVDAAAAVSIHNGHSSHGTVGKTWFGGEYIGMEKWIWFSLTLPLKRNNSKEDNMSRELGLHPGRFQYQAYMQFLCSGSESYQMVNYHPQRSFRIATNLAGPSPFVKISARCSSVSIFWIVIGCFVLLCSLLRNQCSLTA